MARSKIEVQIVGDADSFLRTIRKSESAVRRFGKAAFIAAGAAGAGALFAVFHEGVGEIRESQKVLAQTAAVLKSTGGAAGVSAKQVSTLATQLSNLSGIDDEVIAAGENVLLSFTQIRNAAGKGNDIFTQATKVVADFAARTGRDVPQAALVLGKALADPASKLSSLARAGVVFTKEQLSQVKAIQKTQGVMAAQKVVLDELRKRYAGAAKAAGSTLGGQLNVLRERFQDLSGDILGVFVPTATRAVTAVTNFVKKLSALKTFRARFNFVVSGVENLGRDLLGQITNVLTRTNFEQAVHIVQVQLLRGIHALGVALGKVNFQEVGRALSNSLIRSLAGISAFIRKIDWSKVGTAIVRGIIDFLKGVDWVALFKGVVKLQVAALKALGNLLLGAGKELGKQLLAGLRSVAGEILTFFEKLGLRIALAILKHLNFKVLGHSIIPGVEGLINDLQDRLDALGAEAAKVGKIPGDRGPSSATSSPGNKAGLRTQEKANASSKVAAVALGETADKSKKASDSSKKAADAAKKAADAAKAAAAEAARRFAEARDNAKSVFGAFFSTAASTVQQRVTLGGSRGRRTVARPGESAPTSARDLLVAITAQNKGFAQLTANIAKLAQQGAPASLIRAARTGEISPEQVAAIANANRDVRQRIFSQVRRADRLITQAARADINAKNVAIKAGTVKLGAALSVSGGAGPMEPGVTINGGLHIHGVQNVKQLENELERRRKKRTQQTRGRTGGKR